MTYYCIASYSKILSLTMAAILLYLTVLCFQNLRKSQLAACSVPREVIWVTLTHGV